MILQRLVARSDHARRPLRHSSGRLVLLIAAVLAFLALAPAVQAQPALGVRQEFANAGPGGWGGGVLTMNPPSNPLAGGRVGPTDGYLLASSLGFGNWGTNCRACVEYTGDFTSAGITQLRVWLNDVGVDDFYEIHVSLGNDLNLWQYNVGFSPPEGEWAEFIVDLTDIPNWTQIVGVGTLADALSSVSNILIRHDLAPYIQMPDPTQGDLGIDSILLTNGVVGIGPSPAVFAIRLAAPYPNPARGPVTFALESSDTEPIRVQIFDVSGRSIRSVELAGGATGPRTWMWDGRDDAGRPVAPGAYRVRASSPSAAISRPFTRIR